MLTPQLIGICDGLCVLVQFWSHSENPRNAPHGCAFRQRFDRYFIKFPRHSHGLRMAACGQFAGKKSLPDKHKFTSKSATCSCSQRIASSNVSKHKALTPRGLVVQFG
jgi:hypothetical protein